MTPRSKLTSNKSENLPDQDKINSVIQGKYTLKYININRTKLQNDQYYGGVIGTFCSINWDIHKSDPSKYPMFRDIEQNSDCSDEFQMDIKTISDVVRNYDDEHEGSKHLIAHSMEPTGFVFHESRCGSTLVANSLIAMDPESHRVYSESPPPITAARACGFDAADCPPGRGAEILRDVIYLMGRTNNPKEENLFFKIQSIGSKYISVFIEAFPDTPWIYVYREPVEVMMSHLAQGIKRANCVRQLRDVPRKKIEQLGEDGIDIENLTPFQKCALHLSLLCESAVDGIIDSNNMGRAVNYANIVQKLIDFIIPVHYNLDVSDEAKKNILEVGSRYSKGRGDRAKEWKDDSEKKEKSASPEVKEAAKYFLEELYDQLEIESHHEDAQYYLR